MKLLDFNQKQIILIPSDHGKGWAGRIFISPEVKYFYGESKSQPVAKSVFYQFNKGGGI
jgi:hypothetical protein